MDFCTAFSLQAFLYSISVQHKYQLINFNSTSKQYFPSLEIEVNQDM